MKWSRCREVTCARAGFSVIQGAARIPVDEIEARLLRAGILKSIR